MFSGLSAYGMLHRQMRFFNIPSDLITFFFIRTTLNTTSHDLQESYIHMQQSQGKTISLYLMDGTSEGRWKASLANWNGVGYRIPRDEVKNCGDIADLNKPGVYFLFENEIETGRTFIYIGEADAVRTCIMQPHTFEERGDSWTDAVIFVTTDDSLEKGRVKYLENRFYTLAVDAGCYLVRNGNTPKHSPVSAQCVTHLRGSSAMSCSFFPL